jgi:FkbM family methyltransferase
MKTHTKIFLASLAYRAIVPARRLIGKNGIANVRRRGVNWRLDLFEGIDFSIYLLGAFERSTADTLDRLLKPGDIAFDIGANIGAHTLPMARRVGNGGQVFAFEPTDFAFEKLRTNLLLNPDLQATVHPHQMLLTDNPEASSESPVYSSWPLAGGRELHPKHCGQLNTTKGAIVETIDAFSDRERISRLDLIKIDVDGSEYPVLHGGAETLRKLRPVILMELSPYVHAEQGNSFASLIDLLRTLGYSLEEVGTRRKLPLGAAELEKLIPDGASINAVASFG